MTTKPFRTLSPKLKLAVLSWLCDNTLSSPIIRKYLEMQESNSSAMNQSSRSFSIEKHIAAQSSAEMYVDPLLLPAGKTRGSAASLLGSDRNHSRYWFFNGDITGRIWVESKSEGITTTYRELEERDRLLETLNEQGIRESALSKRIKSKAQDMLGVQMLHSSLYTPSRIVSSCDLLTNKSFEAQIKELIQEDSCLINIDDVSRKSCVIAMKELVRRRWIPLALVPFLRCSLQVSTSSSSLRDFMETLLIVVGTKALSTVLRFARSATLSSDDDVRLECFDEDKKENEKDEEEEENKNSQTTLLAVTCPPNVRCIVLLLLLLTYSFFTYCFFFFFQPGITRTGLADSYGIPGTDHTGQCASKCETWTGISCTCTVSTFR